MLMIRIHRGVYNSPPITFNEGGNVMIRHQLERMVQDLENVTTDLDIMDHDYEKFSNLPFEGLKTELHRIRKMVVVMLNEDDYDVLG